MCRTITRSDLTVPTVGTIDALSGSSATRNNTYNKYCTVHATTEASDRSHPSLCVRGMLDFICHSLQSAATLQPMEVLDQTLARPVELPV